MNHIFSSKTIKAGLLVGTLDITAACLQFYIKTGKGPEPVFRYIASGILGKDAFTGGGMIFWGIFLSLFYRYVFCILFLLAG